MAKMKKVVLYVSDNCAHCKTAKQYLDSQGIKYRLANVKDPRGRKELAALGARAVPTLKVGEQVLHGFNVKQFNQAIS